MISKRSNHAACSVAPRIKPLCALLLSTFATYQLDAQANDAPARPAKLAQVEFDQHFFPQGGSQSVDVSRFEKGNTVLPGTYSVDIYVNQNRVARGDVPFKAVETNMDAQACFDAKLLERVGVAWKKLTPELLARISGEGEDACLPIDELVGGATSRFDFGEQRLDLSIPQVSLARNARGYVSPELWDSGINAAMLGYNFNLYGTHNSGQGDGTQTQGYLGVNGGVNLGNWHFRHDGSFMFDSRGNRQYQDINTYVQRDLPSLASQLTLGEAYTTGELFDSTAFRGMRVASDDRMLPDSLRGYAPTVRGVANSNAKVTIRQNGMVIYETSVAPGAFEINDLYATGYGGDLDVSVQEADGNTHSFSVAYAAVPLSLRPGVSRYSFVVGALRDTQLSSHPLFAQGTWQRGLTNLLTGYGGVTVSAGYVSAMVGGAFNTPLGAIGADVTQASTALHGQGRLSGASFRLSYMKDVAQTGTNVAIAAYRYSTGGFLGLNDAMRARDLAAQNLSIENVWRQRSRASVTMSQRLGERWGQLNLTASTVNYWNRSGSDVNYTIGYNNTFRNIGYSISANRQRNAIGTADTLYYASVTIPLGKATPMTMTGNVSHESSGRTQAQTMLSGSLGTDNNLSYGVTVNPASGGMGSSTTGGSVNALYRSPYAEFSGAVGTGTGYSQGSIGIRGAVVAHPGGVTLSQPLSDTIGIIEAPDAEGARVINASGVRVNSRGYAVVPYLTPYSMNTVEIDPKGLSTDVELQVSSQQIAPRAGSVTLLKFATVSGRSALIRASQSDGTPLPFGAQVLDEHGTEIGSVGQASKIFARGLQNKGELTVKWGEDASSICRIAYALPLREKGRKSQDLLRVNGTCAAARVSHALNVVPSRLAGAAQ
ncbi:fimbria/pilus outer membrane usher protein [Burkholderia sp. MSMB1826]|uniref:fimbria/pilus outer membrane usher protein n=1 Tax=Burkholderia sp. MSMB1826 TaxID=1637875 RepID=UPI00075929A8|nr:fimbria/pilus outer membrane usher protein [Burkholderia sp. MSMB1826]KVL21195.1 fimbrial protein [Burkholderia sp. MSMB1826]